MGSRHDIVNDFFFLIYLMLPVTLGPGVRSASNGNEFKKQKNIVSLSKKGRIVGLRTLPLSASRLCIQCGIRNISQFYRPPRPVNRSSFYFLLFFIYVSMPLWSSGQSYWQHVQRSGFDCQRYQIF
jgi:hypothetical protein